MKYDHDRAIQLKDGRHCMLRTARAEDAAAILAHIKVTSAETNHMLRYPDEITMTPAQEGAFLSALETSPDSIMVCALVDGIIVANGGFNPVSRVDKCKHRAEFGISIQQAYWGMGIGSHILNDLIEAARKAGYTQLELEVVTDNERAIALYEKFGFHTYGTNPHAFRLRNGVYQGLHAMALAL